MCGCFTVGRRTSVEAGPTRGVGYGVKLSVAASTTPRVDGPAGAARAVGDLHHLAALQRPRGPPGIVVRYRLREEGSPSLRSLAVTENPMMPIDGRVIDPVVMI